MPETLTRELAVFSLFIYYPEVGRDSASEALAEFLKVHGSAVRRSISLNYSFGSEILVAVPIVSGEVRIVTFKGFTGVEPALNAFLHELVEAGQEILVEHIQASAALNHKPSGVIQFYFYEK